MPTFTYFMVVPGKINRKWHRFVTDLDASRDSSNSNNRNETTDHNVK